jgi:hypothetical protein
VGAGDGVIGAVGPAEPVANPPVTPETTDDRRPGKSRGAEGATDSDVGIAPEFNAGLVGVAVVAPVPRAVVIPTTMPPDDGCAKGCSLDGEVRPAVGVTTFVGTAPVEPT